MTLFLLQALPLSAQDLEKVVLRTDYKVNGYVGAFVLAKDKGYFKDEGLDVEIGEGQGSAVTVQTVASGRDTFGLADATALVVAVSKSIPVKAVAVYSQTDIQGFAYHKASGWDEQIPSMRGKVVVSSPGSAELSLLPAILAKAGMKISDIDLRLADANAKIPMFIQTPGSFLGAYATGDAVRIRSRMPEMGFVPFSRFGVDTYGTSLIVGVKLLQEKPDLVKRFVRASGRGWDDTLKDPEAAVQALIKQFPDTNTDLARSGLSVMIAGQLHTPATKGKHIGWMAGGDWASMLDLLKTYAGLTPKGPDSYYTNEFVDR